MKGNKKKNVRGKVDILKRPFIFKVIKNILFYALTTGKPPSINALSKSANLSVYQVWIDAKTLNKEGYLNISEALTKKNRPVKYLSLISNKFIFDIIGYIGKEETLADIKVYVEKNLIEKYTSKNLNFKVEEVTGAIYLNIVENEIKYEGIKDKIPYFQLMPSIDRYLDTKTDKYILKEANKIIKRLTQSKYLNDFILITLFLNATISTTIRLLQGKNYIEEEKTLDGYYKTIINHEEELLNKSVKVITKYKTKKEKKEDEELINTLKIALRSQHHAQKTNYGLIGDFMKEIKETPLVKEVFKQIKTLNLNK